MPRIKNAFKAKVLKHALNVPVPNRLVLQKAKWFRDANSPVLLMIDDLTNAWIVEKGQQEDGPDCDWGGKHWQSNSALTFLTEKFLQRFPEAKVTYFTVVGKMHSFNTKSSFTFAEPIDFDAESINFFRALEISSRGEIAYHGLHHGVPRDRSEDYIQEWESFQTFADGKKVINEGKEIFRRAFGYYPRGGKYGGYKTNHLGERTIEEGGFIWWCREWTPRDTTGKIPDAFYELEYFGEKRKIVSIPSTIHGKRWTKRQIDLLIRARQVISIQEHISPRRPDGRRQTPNIYDDIRELNRLYSYLANKNVWHATCSEVANYFIGYTNSQFYDMQKDSFRLDYSGPLPEPLITVIVFAGCLIDRKRKFLQVVLPGGQILSGKHIHPLGDGRQVMIDLPLRTGMYSLVPAEEPSSVLEGYIGERGRIEFNFPDMCGEVELPLPIGHDPFVEFVSPGPHLRYSLNHKGNILFFCKNSSIVHQIRPVQGLFNKEHP